MVNSSEEMNVLALSLFNMKHLDTMKGNIILKQELFLLNETMFYFIKVRKY